MELLLEAVKLIVDIAKVVIFRSAYPACLRLSLAAFSVSTFASRFPACVSACLPVCLSATPLVDQLVQLFSEAASTSARSSALPEVSLQLTGRLRQGNIVRSFLDRDTTARNVDNDDMITIRIS